MSFTVFFNEKTPFYSIKTQRSKSRKIDIFPKALTHGFGPKMAIVSNFVFFFCNIGQGNVFYDILQRKNSFLGYKNTTFKKSKNWHFFKGVNPWFLSKNGHFSKLFFLGNIGQENVFHDILKRKIFFLNYKNKKFKNSKNWHFCKGVKSWFWSRNRDYSKLLFFRQYRPGKCLLRYFTTKKLLSRL